MKILFVDDDDISREVVAAALDESGFRVDVAVDGEEGLALASAASYDVVIVDYQMPGLNGLELLERLARAGRITRDRAVMITGGNIPAEARFHAREVLRKPFHSRELIGVLEEIKRQASG